MKSMSPKSTDIVEYFHVFNTYVNHMRVISDDLQIIFISSINFSTILYGNVILLSLLFYYYKYIEKSSCLRHLLPT